MESWCGMLELSFGVEWSQSLIFVVHIAFYNIMCCKRILSFPHFILSCLYVNVVKKGVDSVEHKLWFLSTPKLHSNMSLHGSTPRLHSVTPLHK